jgi:LPXTG-motif cell wall-anchored protein
MERVGLVILSIVLATALLLGASYGALYLQPLLLDIPTVWMIAAATSMASLGMLLHWRRKRSLSH